jgi:hypothetical protein
LPLIVGRSPTRALAEARPNAITAIITKPARPLRANLFT